MFPLFVLLVASMLLLWSMMLLASMLLKVLLLLSALLLLASMPLSFTHALAGTHVLACVSEVVGSLLLALLHYECCSMMSLLLLFFPSPCRKSLPDSSGHWKEAFAFPNARKFWSLELGKVSLQRPDFYGMEECKMSHSRDRKTFPAFGNAKGLLPGTRKIFGHGECK